MGTVEFGGRALATGYVPNEWLPALYGAADLYLAPSHHEGFGIPVLEAFRCGCPVLSSAGGALPEVVGDAGVIQADNTPEAWRNSIEDLLADGSKLQDLRSRGIEREKHFTWKQHAESTLRAYREVTP
ncbi:MAG: glycosyltransferase [Fimbriimonas sp.]